MRGRLALVLGTVVTLCVLAAACSSEPSDGGVAQRSPDDALTVGSFDFAESRLLAELYSHALEEAGYPVRRAFDLGSREFVGPALVVGLIDLVPEYAGTAAQFFGLGADPPSSSEALTHDRLIGSLRSHSVTALAKAPAQTANTFVVTRQTAQDYGLSTLSDLAGVAPDLVFGGPTECAIRPLCLVGLDKVYGISFKQVASLGEAGGRATLSALRNGYIDVALLFTSDPALADSNLVELRDDRGLQPAENVTPLVRSEVLSRYGSRLAEVLDAVSSRLTTETLRTLNARASGEPDVTAVDVGTVAAEWLDTAGIAVTTDAPDAVPRPGRRIGIESTPPVALDTPEPPVAPSVRRSRRRRRPSGAAPPLPRSIGTSGKGWLVAMAVVVVWVVAVATSTRVERITDRADTFVLRAIARVRVDWLSAVARAISRFGTGWWLTVVAVGLLVAIIAFRRWRHLFTFVLAFTLLGLLGEVLEEVFDRPRPYDVTIIGRWVGYSMPAKSVAVVAFLGVGICYTLVPHGRPRNAAKIVAMVITATFAAAQLYLGVDHPFDVAVSIAFAVAILLNAFRFFTPNEVFPVTYRRGKTAHLDVTGRRGEAIRRAVQDQLGVTVLEAKPIGLAGSGGSTPLRIRVAGDPDTYLFGKLYAMNHVRADRWYKLGRTILYGRLEDELPFHSVRRLVQYEDYALRLLQDVGVPTAAPVGIVELTPEREYLLLTEFVDGSQEIGDALVDDQIIDEGLTLVRRLWDVGLAHRDIKPANLLVKDGHLVVIDVAFLQVRPSPWREAVDLANMMLVLAVRTDAERVYRRALQFFTAEEIAEAFAATRGVASPSQLRAVMKRDGRDLMAQFRALAPPRRPISLQHWSVRRVLLAMAVAATTVVGVRVTFDKFTPIESVVNGTPTCGTDNVMVLMAQTVPSATSLPCLASVPAGWGVHDVHMSRGEARFSITSDQGGHQAAEATLLPVAACTMAGVVEVLSERADMRRFEGPEELPPDLRTTRYYVFDGGCVRYRFAFHGDANPTLMSAANGALAFQPRAALVDEVRSRTGLRLCGADAPPCPGGS